MAVRDAGDDIPVKPPVLKPLDRQLAEHKDVTKSVRRRTLARASFSRFARKVSEGRKVSSSPVTAAGNDPVGDQLVTLLSCRHTEEVVLQRCCCRVVVVVAGW